MRHARLSPHPATACPDLDGIEVSISAGADLLILTYTLSGDLAGLIVPPPSSPQRRDGLWQHTCFEAFVMAGNGPGYREYNFSPSGEWATYAFSGYRDRIDLDSVAEPVIHCHTADNAVQIKVHLARCALPDGMRYRLGLSAVLEHADGRLSYWALRHPPGKPDFHHTDGFALTLELP